MTYQKIDFQKTQRFHRAVKSITRKPRKKPVPREHFEQVSLFAWVKGLEEFYPKLKLLHASFNPGKMSINKAGKMKAEGARAGFPDTHLPVAKFDSQGRLVSHSLYIEMKTKTGKVSEEQKRVFPMLEQEGSRVEVCRSWQHAAKVLCDYLEINQKYCPIVSGLPEKEIQL